MLGSEASTSTTRYCWRCALVTCSVFLVLPSAILIVNTVVVGVWLLGRVRDTVQYHHHSLYVSSRMCLQFSVFSASGNVISRSLVYLGTFNTLFSTTLFPCRFAIEVDQAQSWHPKHGPPSRVTLGFSPSLFSKWEFVVLWCVMSISPVGGTTGRHA